MGLIDKEGEVVVDSKARDAVREYWKQVEEQETKELDRYIAEQEAAPNSRAHSQSPTSQEIQPSDSQRASSSGGCG
jgi:hypothetical protein